MIIFTILQPVRGIAGDIDRGKSSSLIKSQTADSSLDSEQQEQNFYFPFVSHETLLVIADDSPIWAHNSTPDAHEVALFRHTFTLNDVLESAQLHIFADTRYEVWIDGVWFGRGPARFSINSREFDVYKLNSLAKGEHLISVLVQWAPNNRRSESITPYLTGHIQGKSSNGPIVLANTSRNWKVLLADAWKRNAVPVHTWGLIGPTELLDLRLLPAAWNKPNFDDSNWGMASVKETSPLHYTPLLVPRIDPSVDLTADFPVMDLLKATSINISEINYQSRSIPFLENVLIPATILDQGILSPGRRIGELSPGSNNSLSFSATKNTIFSVEILSDSPPIGDVQVDRKDLSWTKADDSRPDVHIGSIAVSTGNHNLKFRNVPADGLTFSISTQDILVSGFPFDQGIHAGRRLLLSEPISQPNAINGQSVDVLKLTFDSLPSYTVLDLGRTIIGRISMKVSGPSGTIVDIGWDERLLNNTLRPLPYPGSLHPQWNQTDSWVLDHHQRVISTIDARAGRYIMISVWGDGPVTLENIQVHEERYPLNESGSFSSSDPLLDRIWKLGVDTLYSNLSDAYSDPWRERGQWWGDAYVIQQSSRIVFGERDLLKRGILYMEEAFSNGRPNALAPNGDGNHILDYGMLWVFSLSEYIQLSGDTGIINDVYPALIDFIAHLETYSDFETGLLDIPEGHWSETVYIDTIGIHSRKGKSTAVNAMFSETLQRAAEIADYKSDLNRANLWRQRADSIKSGINQYLFDPTTNQYYSSIFQGEFIPPSAHAQAWTLAHGIVPADKVQAVANSLLSLISYDPSSPDFEIYGTYWVLKALGNAGFVDQAVDLIKIYYGHLLDSGATTTWENYAAHESYTQSLSHGWGSSPTWFLSTFLLGAKLTGPGSWEISPKSSNLERVSGILPVQDGVLEAAWTKTGCRIFNLELSSPEFSEGVLDLSNIEGVKEIIHNGETLWGDHLAEASVESSSMKFYLSGGDHNLSIQREC